MKYTFLKTIAFILLVSLLAKAQGKNQLSYPIPQDVQSLDGIIKAYYEVISGPAGEARDWERDKSLHHPSALVVVTGKDTNGKSYIITENLSDYHKSFGISTKGFYEYEIERKTQTFGNITHVWSSYETKQSPSGPVTDRGINSIQLYHDGTRWWILSWMFDSERPDSPLPKF